MATDIQKQVDDLVAAPKSMSGTSSWTLTDYSGQHRWLSTLQIDGEGTGLDFIVDAIPSSPSLRFTITLNFGRCISRFDGWEHDRHNNHPVKGKMTPSGIVIGMLFGPHCHLWSDNRHLVVNEKLPEELEFAIKPSSNVRGFDNSFRWFCGSLNIECGHSECPTLPPRDTLL